MVIIAKILPIILIFVVVYLLYSDVYPKYLEMIDLVKVNATERKKLEQLNNKENEIINLEKDIKSINQRLDRLIQSEEITNKQLSMLIPKEPDTENLLLTMENFFNTYGNVFRGIDFNIETKDLYLDNDLLPVKTINFNIQLKAPLENLKNIINSIDSIAPILVIKKINLAPDAPINLEVETYYFPYR